MEVDVTNNNIRHDAGGISIHAVDIARGIPADGLQVRLWRIDGGRTQVASGTCSNTGVLDHPVSLGKGVERGMYEIEFEVASYYRDNGISVPDPSFLEVAIYRFGIDVVTEHFHLPFKFTPWGFSLFRGGQ
jgi:5-hydroxyisourate hydrolase-like protein (transthyretin family)